MSKMKHRTERNVIAFVILLAIAALVVTQARQARDEYEQTIKAAESTARRLRQTAIDEQINQNLESMRRHGLDERY